MAIKISTLMLHFCFIPSFMVTSFVCLTFVIMFHFTLRLINIKLHKKIIRHLIIWPYAHVAFITDWWSLLDLNIYMNKREFCDYFGKEKALLILNHSYDIDWLVLMAVCARMNLLGNVKGFLKKSLQYIPIIGWSFAVSEYGLLHRNYEKDKKIITDTIKNLAASPYTIWLFLYPEGTWFNKHNHERSQAYAEKMNLPQLKYHLQPRAAGFVTALKAMRGRFKALYDMEICFRKTDQDYSQKPSLADILERRQFIVDIYIKRITEEDIPTETEQQKLFLLDIYQTKDRLRGSYIETGSFFITSGVPAEERLKIERPFYIVVIFSLCCSLTTTWILYGVIQVYHHYGLIIALCPFAVIELCLSRMFDVAVKATVIR